MKGLAVFAIDLIVEEEVGSQPAGGVRVDASERIPDDEGGRRSRAVVVLHAESHLHGRHAVEQHRHGVAEADVLRALADVE